MKKCPAMDRAIINRAIVNRELPIAHCSWYTRREGLILALRGLSPVKGQRKTLREIGTRGQQRMLP